MCKQPMCICAGAVEVSADCYYLGAADHERLERTERERERQVRAARDARGTRHAQLTQVCARHHGHAQARENVRPMPDELQREYDVDHEVECDLERRARIAEGITFPAHYLDSSHHGGCVDRPWVRADEREREREERRARTGGPPPHRDEERYGPLAHNPEGDEAFRSDRRAWYERATGESLAGVSLAEQWQRADAYARRFRVYSDGRAQAVVPPVAPPARSQSSTSRPVRPLSDDFDDWGDSERGAAVNGYGTDSD